MLSQFPKPNPSDEIPPSCYIPIIPSSKRKKKFLKMFFFNLILLWLKVSIKINTRKWPTKYEFIMDFIHKVNISSSLYLVNLMWKNFFLPIMTFELMITIMCRWNPLKFLSFLLYIIFVSMSSNNKVDLIIELGNLLVPFVLDLFSKILTWNMKVNNCIDSTFLFMDCSLWKME